MQFKVTFFSLPLFVEKQIKYLMIEFRYYFTASGWHRVNVWEWNYAFLWITVCGAFNEGVCMWHGTPDERDEVTSRAVPRSLHCTIDRDQNVRRKIMRIQETSNPKRFLSDRNDSYLIIIIGVFIKYFYTWSGCVPIYSHQIWISDIFGSAGFRVFFFTEFPAVNCGIFLGCSFSLSIPSILHTNTHA